MGNDSTAALGALRGDEETLKGLLDAEVDSICRAVHVSCLTDTPACRMTFRRPLGR